MSETPDYSQVADLNAKLAAMTQERNDLDDTRQGLEAELSHVRQQRNLFRASMQERLRDHGDACERERALKQQLDASEQQIQQLTKHLAYVKAQEVCQLVTERDQLQAMVTAQQEEIGRLRELRRLYDNAVTCKQEGHALPE